MIVCHCRGVTDRRIREAIREGASCRSEVARACDAARHCGGCAPLVDAILVSEAEPRVAPALPARPEPAVAAG